MGFLIKAAAGYGALADFILTGGRRGFAKGTGDFNAALAEQLAQINRAKKHGTTFNGGAIDSLENYQLQGWLRSLAENGTLNASDARALGLVGPIKPVKAWTPRAMQNFIATAREAIGKTRADKDAARRFYAMLNDGHKLSADQMRQASDVLYVKVLEHLAALRKQRRQTLTMRDAALARYLANDPRLLRGSNGAIDIANQLAAGRTNFNRDFRNAVRGGFDEYLATAKAKPNTPVPPKKPGDAPDVPPGDKPVPPEGAPDVPPKKPGDAPDAPPPPPPPLPPGDKSKPGLLRWRNLGIGAGGLGLAGAITYGITRPGEVSNEVEADSRNADVPLPTQDAEWNNAASAYYNRLRGDSSFQNQLYNVGMTSPGSLQRNLGNQLNYLSGPAPGVPLGLQPGVPIRLYQ